MFSFLKKLFGSQPKSRKVELEAKLHPTPQYQYGGKGEVEISIYPCGTTKIEVEVKYSSIPDGSQVEVVYGGQSVMTLLVNAGFAKQEMRFGPDQQLPEVTIGDSAEFHLDGVCLYQGTFRPD